MGSSPNIWGGGGRDSAEAEAKAKFSRRLRFDVQGSPSLRNPPLSHPTHDTTFDHLHLGEGEEEPKLKIQYLSKLKTFYSFNLIFAESLIRQKNENYLKMI